MATDLILEIFIKEGALKHMEDVKRIAAVLLNKI